MVAGVNSLNSILAANYSQIGKEAAVQQLRAQEAAVKTEAQNAQTKFGVNATVTTQYTYGQGPDGQLYVTGATITSQKQVEGAINPLTRDGKQPGKNAYQQETFEERQEEALKDFAKPKANLSPSEEVQIFSIDAFRDEAFHSVDNLNRARYQAVDFGVRAQESQHFRAGAGITTPPEYTFEEGPDGVFYAVAGEVGVDPVSGVTPEKAVQDADTAARAALAATDVSAQDISAARASQADAASLRGQISRQQQVADLYQRNYKAMFDGAPAYNMAA